MPNRDPAAAHTAPQRSSPPHRAGTLPQDEQWSDDLQELPRRPRRRLLTPASLALLAVLLSACGFIGGVLVEKGETSSSPAAGSTAGGFASRLAALRGGSSSASSASTSGTAGASTGFRRPTAGTVAYLAGNSLYVTDSEGNTIKVDTSAATRVTKTVKTVINAVHPGETVTVLGSTGAKGVLSAESISVGSTLTGLFGGASKGGGATAGSGGSRAGEPALFGPGG